MVFKKGDVIANQQIWITNNENLYYIASGSCVTFHENELGTKRVEKRYQGNVIGEMAFFLKAPRSESIVADEDDTVVYEYTHKQFDALKKEFPYIGEHMLKHALQKMSDAVQRISHENHLLMVMDGYEDENEDDDDVLGLNEAGDTEVAAAGNANGRFGKRAAKSEDGATKQRREAGVEEDQDSSKHKTSAFAILSVDDDLNESATSIELKRQQALVMESE
jgi:CRP-like cAMP-binding protein